MPETNRPLQTAPPRPISAATECTRDEPNPEDRRRFGTFKLPPARETGFEAIAPIPDDDVDEDFAFDGTLALARNDFDGTDFPPQNLTFEDSTPVCAPGIDAEVTPRLGLDLDNTPRLAPHLFENYRQNNVQCDTHPDGMGEVTKETLWKAYQDASEGGQEVVNQVLDAAASDKPQPNWMDVKAALTALFATACEFALGKAVPKPDAKPLPQVVSLDKLEKIPRYHPDQFSEHFDPMKYVPAYRGKRKDGEAIDFLKKHWGPWLDGVSLPKNKMRSDLDPKLIARLEWWQSQPGNTLEDSLFASFYKPVDDRLLELLPQNQLPVRDYKRLMMRKWRAAKAAS